MRFREEGGIVHELMNWCSCEACLGALGGLHWLRIRCLRNVRRSCLEFVADIDYTSRLLSQYIWLSACTGCDVGAL